MRLFARSRPSVAPSVTPYPLENRIIDISRDASVPKSGKTTDLEKGGFGTRPAGRQAIRNDSFSQNRTVKTVSNNPQSAAVPYRNVSSIPTRLPIVPRLVFKPSPSSAKQARMTQPAPLFVVTNFTRVPAPPRKIIPSKSQDENNPSDPPTPPPKDRPRWRKSRYLSISPQKSSGIKTSPDKIDTSRQKTNRDGPAPYEVFGSSGGYGPVNSLELESSYSGESVDWAARIRSVFYKNREADEDLSASVRNLFSRDSATSSISFDHSMGILTAGDLLHDENKGGARYSSSSSGTSLPFISAPTSPLPRSESSEIPYLRDSFTGDLSMSGSTSSGAFNDLLASVERKYPGQRWKDIVEFSTNNQDDGGMGVNPYNGIAEEEKQQWSDVLCIDEYTH
ncbi:hypothetical protein K438DRAFT_1808694 [Mycena galopus ATCC 62051]|nr:hypothetical protein K438DRAFT_1808694 [Mycena galopus ATCC 62051]